MKLIKITILLLVISKSIIAQKSVVVNEYAAIDKKALFIPDSLTNTPPKIADYINLNFKTENEKVRAAFIWVASNIQYDIENMYSLNFYEKKEEKISKSLRTRKGICENYASLFTEICNNVGIKSTVIEGYTKQNGKTDYLPHAWSGALIDNTWFLFDPTWGSGYVNAGKFIKKINNEYYKVNPNTLIKSHMPFDYLWQFLNYTITYQEFQDSKILPNKNKTFFKFNDSIQAYEKLNHIEQLESTAYRIEKNGIKNSMVFDRYQHIKIEIEHDKQNQKVNLYNSAVVDYNQSIKNFNDFIEYRNKQFIPKKSDSEIQFMFDKSTNKLNEAKNKLAKIINSDENTVKMMQQISTSIEEMDIKINEQKEWLKQYFSKSKSGRKSMFYKVSWFGIPLN
jgi:transglutaminase/protease-like cytokinesis protein 3